MAKNEKAETILTDNLLKYLEEIEKDPEVITHNPEVQKLLLSFSHERSIEVSRVESEILQLKARNIYDGKMLSAKATIILCERSKDGNANQWRCLCCDIGIFRKCCE